MAKQRVCTLTIIVSSESLSLLEVFAHTVIIFNVPIVFKSVKVIFQGYSEQERGTFRDIIFSNILYSVTCLIEYALHDPTVSESEKKVCTIFMSSCSCCCDCAHFLFLHVSMFVVMESLVYKRHWCTYTRYIC